VSIAEAPVASVKKRIRPEPAEHQVDRRTPAGSVLGSVQLDPEWFGQEPNVALMHQVVVAQLAAARSGTQSTKTRAEVAGGGAKPFRQKGMGRSRQGSIRAPHWVGGGVAFGPKPRSYRQRTPKKMIRQALRSALSDRAALERVVLVNDWGFEIPKTKRAVAALASLGIDGRILVVLGQDDVVAERSFGNIQRIQTLLVGELNAYDVLRNDWIVFTDESLPGGVGDISSHKLPEDADAEITDAPEPAAQEPTDTKATDQVTDDDQVTDTDTVAADTEVTDATDDDTSDSADDATATVAEGTDEEADADEAEDAGDDTGETES
jgi:large subunit ribosomal protein L4